MDGLNYVVIDFETANQSRASACSLGMLKILHGEIAGSYYRLIDPETYFDPRNIAIHGITNADVSGAPAYPKIVDDMQTFIKGYPVVAHFAPFDTGVIRDSNQRYDVHFEFDYFDSYYLSRSLINPKIPSYRLNEVAHYLGYRTFRHHHAFEDCKACAYIIDKLAEINQTNTIEDLIHAGGYKHFGHVHSNETWYGFTKKKTPRYANSFTSLDNSKGNNANKERFLYGKMLLSQGNEKA